MKVAIGYHVQDGPWGGGNQMARALADALRARGDAVTFTLADPDIDLILLTDPRGRAPTISFAAGAILRYLLTRNPRALVVHRINECDERKGTLRMNAMLKRANYVADHTVFIGSWLRDLDLWRRESTESVVLNGADAGVFRGEGGRSWDGQEPLRLVTHHWGGNRRKGFDVYEMVDGLLADPAWADRIAFTYVGNIPKDAGLRNARVLAPMAGEELARELASHHVYLTASINEPAGMHHIEGALSGLPLLYRRSGALPEYCAGYGEGFDGPDDVLGALSAMMKAYPGHLRAMASYPHTAERMCRGYLDLFDRLMDERDQRLAARRLWRSPWMVVRNQSPV